MNKLRFASIQLMRFNDMLKVVKQHEKLLQFGQLASLAKWLSVRLRTKWFWDRVQFHKPTQIGFSTNCSTARQKSFPKSHFSSFAIKQRGN